MHQFIGDSNKYYTVLTMDTHTPPDLCTVNVQLSLVKQIIIDATKLNNVKNAWRCIYIKLDWRRNFCFCIADTLNKIQLEQYSGVCLENLGGSGYPRRPGKWPLKLLWTLQFVSCLHKLPQKLTLNNVHDVSFVFFYFNSFATDDCSGRHGTFCDCM